MNQQKNNEKQLDANKLIVQNLLVAIDQQDKDEVMKILHPEHKLKYPGNDELISRDGHWQMIQARHASFSDMKHNHEQQIAEGDLVVTRGTITGTNDGPFQGNPPTEKSINVPFINISRIVDGRICGIFTLSDTISMLKQLGVTE